MSTLRFCRSPRIFTSLEVDENLSIPFLVILLTWFFFWLPQYWLRSLESKEVKYCFFFESWLKHWSVTPLLTKTTTYAGIVKPVLTGF